LTPMAARPYQFIAGYLHSEFVNLFINVVI
jgi:hypothetical protein